MISRAQGGVSGSCLKPPQPEPALPRRAALPAPSRAVRRGLLALAPPSPPAPGGPMNRLSTWATGSVIEAQAQGHSLWVVAEGATLRQRKRPTSPDMLKKVQAGRSGQRRGGGLPEPTTEPGCRVQGNGACWTKRLPSSKRPCVATDGARPRVMRRSGQCFMEKAPIPHGPVRC